MKINLLKKNILLLTVIAFFAFTGNAFAQMSPQEKRQLIQKKKRDTNKNNGAGYKGTFKDNGDKNGKNDRKRNEAQGNIKIDNGNRKRDNDAERSGNSGKIKVNPNAGRDKRNVDKERSAGSGEIKINPNAERNKRNADKERGAGDGNVRYKSNDEKFAGSENQRANHAGKISRNKLEKKIQNYRDADKGQGDFSGNVVVNRNEKRDTRNKDKERTDYNGKEIYRSNDEKFAGGENQRANHSGKISKNKLERKIQNNRGADKERGDFSGNIIVNPNEKRDTRNKDKERTDYTGTHIYKSNDEKYKAKEDRNANFIGKGKNEISVRKLENFKQDMRNKDKEMADRTGDFVYKSREEKFETKENTKANFTGTGKNKISVRKLENFKQDMRNKDKEMAERTGDFVFKSREEKFETKENTKANFTGTGKNQISIRKLNNFKRDMRNKDKEASNFTGDFLYKSKDEKYEKKENDKANFTGTGKNKISVRKLENFRRDMRNKDKEMSNFTGDFVFRSKDEKYEKKENTKANFTGKQKFSVAKINDFNRRMRNKDKEMAEYTGMFRYVDKRKAYKRKNDKYSDFVGGKNAFRIPPKPKGQFTNPVRRKNRNDVATYSNQRFRTGRYVKYSELAGYQKEQLKKKRFNRDRGEVAFMTKGELKSKQTGEKVQFRNSSRETLDEVKKKNKALREEMRQKEKEERKRKKEHPELENTGEEKKF